MKPDIIVLVIQVAECWIYIYIIMHSSPSNESIFSCCVSITFCTTCFRSPGLSSGLPRISPGVLLQWSQQIISVVSITIWLWPERKRVQLRTGPRIFSLIHNVQTVLGSTQSRLQCVLKYLPFTPAIRRPEHTLIPLYNSEIQDAVELYSHAPCTLPWHGEGQFTFKYYLQ
jgi:hypothetical protein